jgi:hypothetical protein
MLASLCYAPGCNGIPESIVNELLAENQDGIFFVKRDERRLSSLPFLLEMIIIV